MNKSGIFWLTIGSMLTTIYLLILLIIFIRCYSESIYIEKIYAIPILPLIIYNMLQFFINYVFLTDK